MPRIPRRPSPDHAEVPAEEAVPDDTRLFVDPEDGAARERRHASADTRNGTGPLLRRAGDDRTPATGDDDPAIASGDDELGASSTWHDEFEDDDPRSTPGPATQVIGDRPAAPDDDGDEYRWHTGERRPTGNPDAVEFVDTHKAFGRSQILRGLNMGLPEGMISMILGPSGTGKSVCIKHMVGLLYPDDGDVLVHGESVPYMGLDELLQMRQKFGVLFQDGALFGSMDIYDNTAFPLRQHTEKSEDEIQLIVERRLEEVGLASAHDKFPNELSGGMKKRAGFARALVLDPSIVLFDEPDSGLDPVRTALLGELIKEVHAETMEDADEQGWAHKPAFTLITHDIMTARKVAQFINVVWRGRIVESGPAEDLFNSENAFVHQFLAGASGGPLGMN